MVVPTQTIRRPLCKGPIDRCRRCLVGEAVPLLVHLVIFDDLSTATGRKVPRPTCNVRNRRFLFLAKADPVQHLVGEVQAGGRRRHRTRNGRVNRLIIQTVRRDLPPSGRPI